MTRPDASRPVADAIRAAVAKTHLATISKASLEALLAEANLIDVPAGGITDGDSRRSFLHVIVTGLIRAFLTSPQGRQATIRYVRPGQLIGTSSLFSPPQCMNAQAVVDSRYAVFSVPLTQRLVETDATVALALCREMADRQRDYFNELSSAHFGTLRQRLVRHLLDVATEGQTSSRLVVTLTQQNLADAVGSVREVVARALHTLRAEGLIASGDHGIELLDPVRLQAELDLPGV